MRMILVASLLFFLYSCGSENEHQLKDDSLYFELNELDQDMFLSEYDDLKIRIDSKRKKLSTQPNAEVKKYLLSTLTDSVFHFWYDTEWDFNGVTQKPRQGNIACGYFVTTTLLHSGFDLQRVKLAQQAASVIIETLCDPTSIKSFSNGNLKGLKNHLKKSGDGLYIIGLDNHVGFIHKEDTSIVMIHSDVVNGKVCRERINDCKPIVNSKFHMIGNLLGNQELLNKWKKNEKIRMSE